jgi:hypothetical protein
MGSVQIKMRCKRNPNPNPKDVGVIPRRHAGSATSASGKGPTTAAARRHRGCLDPPKDALAIASRGRHRT